MSQTRSLDSGIGWQNVVKTAKGRTNARLCLLYELHRDVQELSFKCPSVRDKINIIADYEKIFE